jgi:hypothetical protein
MSKLMSFTTHDPPASTMWRTSALGLLHQKL